MRYVELCDSPSLVFTRLSMYRTDFFQYNIECEVVQLLSLENTLINMLRSQGRLIDSLWKLKPK